MGKSVSILIVSFNTRDLTLACLESVYAQTSGLDFEVIVVDNASEDGSAEAIGERFPQVQLICAQENLGFGRATNLAARAASGECLLLLNSDTVILDNAVRRVFEFSRENVEAGIFGGRTFFEDGRLNPTSCHGRQSPWSLLCLGTGISAVFRGSKWFDPESLGAWKRDTVREVDAVTGCFLLIRRSLWEALKGFDESFFMYGEDTDLCLRAWACGSRCMICPDAKVIHHGGQSDRVRSEKILRLCEAKARLIWKHWATMQARFGIRMLDMWCLTRMTATLVASKLSTRYEAGHGAWKEVWRARQRFHGRNCGEAGLAGAIARG
ncbi:MAG TPA: glycosyltransferase family 2 protein [Tepidisphaeraceae bacterium]|jgi:GT2 family glycosyltransferase